MAKYKAKISTKSTLKTPRRGCALPISAWATTATANTMPGCMSASNAAISCRFPIKPRCMNHLSDGFVKDVAIAQQKQTRKHDKEILHERALVAKERIAEKLDADKALLDVNTVITPSSACQGFLLDNDCPRV